MIKTTQIPPAPTPSANTAADYYTSPDRQVGIRIKRQTARQFPARDYPVPVVEIILEPKPHTRVQQRADGKPGLNIILTKEEIKKLIEALGKVDPGFVDSLSATPGGRLRRA